MATPTPKGTATRQFILDRAYGLACKAGIEGLSIGGLAEACAMSKSGVFAHFGSREDLQLAVLQEAGERFGAVVLMPAVRLPRGMVRLRTIIVRWLDWIESNADGCVIMGAVAEVDARPGVLRDRVIDLIGRWREATTRAVTLAVSSAELPARTDAAQLAFEVYGVALAFHHDIRLFDPAASRRQADRAIARLLAFPPEAMTS